MKSPREARISQLCPSSFTPLLSFVSRTACLHRSRSADMHFSTSAQSAACHGQPFNPANAAPDKTLIVPDSFNSLDERLGFRVIVGNFHGYL